ncbi:MAG: hypothetical protein DRJ07_00510 [Bacteroidetes bacterium]|nr:MAG: hypothetical protein DRJ07_00510 [Bacteroidota bacterium]
MSGRMKNNEPGLLSRRGFINRLIASGAVIGGVSLFGNKIFAIGNKKPIRRFHISMQAEAWLENPELISIMKNAGISDVWMGSYLQGKWYHTPTELRESADFLKSKGFNAHVLTVPLGHPGNAIDPSDDSWSEKKENWENACDYDGSLYSGTSIHSPVVEDNIEAHKLLADEGFDILFLDDDFRLGKYPGKIGGCFCDNCKNDFLKKYNYNSDDWEMLIESVEKRDPTKVLRSWIEYICDKEYDMFVALQKATPQMEIGIMVMYFGAEKSGIDLSKYQDVPFRVGEMMFGDDSFGKVKGKTDELFSALFHMRFVKPELAYSESTTYPQDALSAKNMAAKLTVSLFTDVRNTMFMSGLQPFPVEYWKTLAPAMKKSARIHEEIAGLKPEGPFKHYWGWDSRLVGKDQPFSLFLASGIPFEVIDELTSDGWIFLSNEDAKSVVEGRVVAQNNNLVVRKESELVGDNFIQLEETMDDIFAFKKRLIPSLRNIPYIDGDIPAVFSWYPVAGKALIWNVNEVKQSYKIILNEKALHEVSIDGLDVVLISV